MFLIPEDYKPAIRKEIQAIVNQNDEISQQEAEGAAQVMIESYLKERYDMAKLFPVVHPFDEDASYEPGDLVYFADAERGRIYACSATSTPGPQPDLDEFEASDPRNKLIIRQMVDLTLYELYKSSPQRLTDIRIKAYDDAISWLNRVAAGKISPAFPEYENPDDSADTIRWGSNPKMGHNY